MNYLHPGAPGDSEYMRLKGNEFFSNNEFDKAIHCYLVGIECDNADPLLYSNMSLAYLSLKLFDKAENAAKKAIELDGSSAKGYFRAAKAAYGLGDRKKAIRYLYDGLKKPVVGSSYELQTYLCELLKENCDQSNPSPCDIKSEEISEDFNESTETNLTGKGSKQTIQEESLTSKKAKRNMSPAVNVTETCASGKGKRNTSPVVLSSSGTTPVKSKKSSSLTEVKLGSASCSGTLGKTGPIESKDINNDQFLQTVESILKTSKNSVPSQLEKRKLSLGLLAIMQDGSNFLLRGLMKTAATKYEEALDLLSECPGECLGFSKMEEVVLKYTASWCWLQSKDYPLLEKSCTYLNGIREKFGSQLPAVFFALGMLFCKLNRYHQAKKYLDKGLNVATRNPSFKPYHWPTTSVIIKETTTEGLQESIKNLLPVCTEFHPPDAVCKYKKDICNRISNQILPSEFIYLSDPDFVGYVIIICQMKCRIQYHVACWKDMKEKRSLNSGGKVTDKDMLGLPCPTNACVTSTKEFSVIITVQIIGDKGELKSWCEREPVKVKEDRADAPIKESKKSKKKTEKNKANAPCHVTSTASAVPTTASSITSAADKDKTKQKPCPPPAVEKATVPPPTLETAPVLPPAFETAPAPPPTVEKAPSPPPTALRTRVVAKPRVMDYSDNNYYDEDGYVDIRDSSDSDDLIIVQIQSRQLAARDNYRRLGWQPMEANYGRDDLSTDLWFLTKPVDTCQDFIFSFFHDFLNKEGPQPITEIEDRWEAEKKDCQQYRELAAQSNFPGIINYLGESHHFVVVNDYIGPCRHAPAVFEQATNDITDCFEFLLKDYISFSKPEGAADADAPQLPEVDLPKLPISESKIKNKNVPKMFARLPEEKHSKSDKPGSVSQKNVKTPAKYSPKTEDSYVKKAKVTDVVNVSGVDNSNTEQHTLVVEKKLYQSVSKVKSIKDTNIDNVSNQPDKFTNNVGLSSKTIDKSNIDQHKTISDCEFPNFSLQYHKQPLGSNSVKPTFPVAAITEPVTETAGIEIIKAEKPSNLSELSTENHTEMPVNISDIPVQVSECAKYPMFVPNMDRSELDDVNPLDSKSTSSLSSSYHSLGSCDNYVPDLVKVLVFESNKSDKTVDKSGGGADEKPSSSSILGGISVPKPLIVMNPFWSNEEMLYPSLGAPPIHVNREPVSTNSSFQSSDTFTPLSHTQVASDIPAVSRVNSGNMQEYSSSLARGADLIHSIKNSFTEDGFRFPHDKSTLLTNAECQTVMTSEYLDQMVDDLQRATAYSAPPPGGIKLEIQTADQELQTELSSKDIGQIYADLERLLGENVYMTEKIKCTDEITQIILHDRKQVDNKNSELKQENITLLKKKKELEEENQMLRNQKDNVDEHHNETERQLHQDMKQEINTHKAQHLKSQQMMKKLKLQYLKLVTEFAELKVSECDEKYQSMIRKLQDAKKVPGLDTVKSDYLTELFVKLTKEHKITSTLNKEIMDQYESLKQDVEEADLEHLPKVKNAEIGGEYQAAVYDLDQPDVSPHHPSMPTNVVHINLPISPQFQPEEGTFYTFHRPKNPMGASNSTGNTPAVLQQQHNLRYPRFTPQPNFQQNHTNVYMDQANYHPQNYMMHMQNFHQTPNPIVGYHPNHMRPAMTMGMPFNHHFNMQRFNHSQLKFDPQQPNAPREMPGPSASRDEVGSLQQSVNGDRTQSNSLGEDAFGYDRHPRNVKHLPKLQNIVPIDRDTKDLTRLLEELKKRHSLHSMGELQKCLDNLRNKDDGILSQMPFLKINALVSKELEERAKAKINAWAPLKQELPNWKPEKMEDDCVICMDKMHQKKTHTLDCHHTYHQQCIKQWLSRNSVCPVCNRHSVMSDEFPPLK